LRHLGRRGAAERDTEVNQPWHSVVIPTMGLTMGEMFYVKELAEDCDADGIYEFFFCGAPLVITGGTGSPINPQAIKKIAPPCKGRGGSGGKPGGGGARP